MIPYQQTKVIPGPDWYRDSIAELDARFPEDVPGFFGPKSITWKIYREPGILLGSHRALLLQVAHPAVAAGVQQYSNFRRDYLGRAHRTFLNMVGIFFGSCRLAKKRAGHLHALHYRVKGTYRNLAGKKRHFCANDPRLLSWILATLVDTSLTAYELLELPLSQAEKERFVEESQIIAQLMGIPVGYYPESYESFYRYYHQMIDEGELEVGATAKSLAKDILRGPFPALQNLNTLFATALLPPRLVEDYQLPWDARREKRFRRYLGRIRRLYHCCPEFLRHAPPYYQAKIRIALSSHRH